MQIRIREDKQSTRQLEKLCRQIGHQWPPRDQGEAVAILTKAGFSEQRLEQFLAMAFSNVPGDELPQYYTGVGEPRFEECVTTPEEHLDEFGTPIFTPRLVEGLRKYIRHAADDIGTYDVTIKMLCKHIGRGRTPVRNALKNEQLDKERRGREDWFRYAQLRPFLRAKKSTTKFDWPSSVAGLRKPAKTSK